MASNSNNLKKEKQTIKLKKCLICTSSVHLRSFKINYMCNGFLENYNDLIQKCFNLQFLSDPYSGVDGICGKCVARLRYTYEFRKRIEIAYDQLKWEITQLEDSKRNIDINKLENSIKIEDQSKMSKSRIKLKRMSMAESTCDNKIQNQTIHSESKNSFTYLDSSFLEDFKDESDSDDNWSVTSQEMDIASGVHMRRSSNPFDPDACSCCGKTFKDHFLLVEHFRRHFAYFVCEFCGKTFPRMALLLPHLNVHNDSRNQCPKCDKSFKHKNSYYRHLKVFHSELPQYDCSKCPMKFFSGDLLKLHQYREHGCERYIHKCSECNKVFIKQSKMDLHYRQVHLKEKTLTCDICIKKFFSKDLLHCHMATHSDERNHQCALCEKMFKLKKHLIQHTKTHTKFKKYTCNECQETFPEKSALKAHFNLFHAQDSPFLDHLIIN